MVSLSIRNDGVIGMWISLEYAQMMLSYLPMAIMVNIQSSKKKGRICRQLERRCKGEG